MRIRHANNEGVKMDSFEKIKCLECDSLELDIIEVDEYNGILRLRCQECGYEFTKSLVEMAVAM